MQAIFTNQFLKDIQKLKDKHLAKNVEEVILEVKIASDLSEIKNLTKLKGYQNVYRIRIGDYRIGLFISDSTIEFVRFMNRKDIYKYFP